MKRMLISPSRARVETWPRYRLGCQGRPRLPSFLATCNALPAAMVAKNRPACPANMIADAGERHQGLQDFQDFQAFFIMQEGMETMLFEAMGFAVLPHLFPIQSRG